MGGGQLCGSSTTRHHLQHWQRSLLASQPQTRPFPAFLSCARFATAKKLAKEKYDMEQSKHCGRTVYPDDGESNENAGYMEYMVFWGSVLGFGDLRAWELDVCRRLQARSGSEAL